MDYVVGFVFHPDYSVYLIRKKRPAWQFGKLNGIGGKIEGTEMSFEAMRRECLEEGGIDINDWKYIAYLKGCDWNVFVYGAIIPYNKKLITMTDEEIGLYNGNDIMRLNTISSIKYLIPMTWENMNYNFTFKSAFIEYGEHEF